MMKEFDAIIGYYALKKELIQIADCLKDRERYARLGGKPPCGLLLHGEPGVGKTLMANCLIAASGLSVYTFRKENSGEKFADALRENFRQAEENAPSIVFLDDMDKFSDTEKRHSNAPEYVEVQACIDEVKGKNVFVLATVNSLYSLPESLTRPGRFDRILEVEEPSEQDAEEIVRHYLAKKQVAEDLDPSAVARMLSGRSCAQLETVLNEAALIAGYGRCDRITMDHFNEACLRTLFEVPVSAIFDREKPIDLADRNDAMAQAVWHEAGHTVIAEVLQENIVTFATVYPSSLYERGFVAYSKASKTARDRDWEIRILRSLGGAAATDLIYGTADLGAGRDFDTAFRLVEKLQQHHCITEFSLHGLRGDDSPELRRELEGAVARDVSRYFRMAKEILALNREFFEAIAKELAQQRILTSAEIREIRQRFSLRQPSLT
ncbi:MAG: AAA family ATPase, partial [Clostridia bacterium]|nr:AAA family ATPase [Clostridia bacterium]